MLAGHGPMIGPPADLIAERVGFHDRRAAKLAAMVGREPLTVYELATRMWKGLSVVQPHLTLSEVIGHLDLLEAAGQVTEVPVGDGVVGFVAAG